MTPLLV